MSFSTATIQGTVMMVEAKQTPQNRSTLVMLVAVPDKRSKDENNHYTRSNTYQVRVWDAQALNAVGYVSKYDTITCSGNITGSYRTKDKTVNDKFYPSENIISIDFASIIDFKKRPEKDNKEKNEIEDAAKTAEEVVEQLGEITKEMTKKTKEKV